MDGGVLYWLESRPNEGGRSVLVRLGEDGSPVDLTPAGMNVRTRVHEYGGGAYLVHRGVIYFVHLADQRVYCQRGAKVPYAITPEGQARYADFAVDVARRRLICVREDHAGGGEPVNTLASIWLDESPRPIDTLVSGHDFYASPRLSPDGRRLCWLAWRHPDMPWDATELWVAAVGASGVLENARVVAGGAGESVCQPGWSSDGSLYFVSDRDGWWRFYRVAADALSNSLTEIQPVLHSPPDRTEFGRPQWVLGMRLWAWVDAQTIVASWTRGGHSGLARLDVEHGTCTEVSTDIEPMDDIALLGLDVVCIGASATSLPALVRVSLGDGRRQTFCRSSTVDMDEDDVSKAETLWFESPDGSNVHAFYYPPTNRSCRADAADRPPLIVISHGGPTDAARPGLRLATQYWTTRGFAVVDVNYRGSSGFGREYRERLNGKWGLADVADCISAARRLVSIGKADPRRLIIRGGSAGGYTTLAALAFHPGVFSAGASYYGVCDLEVLARDTHKFESRYLDRLVGPYPDAQSVYRERSPIHAADRLACPLILFQGEDDKVVPPNQARLMTEALKSKGLPVALVMFEGEQHGFRKASSVIRALEAELWFYGAVFGFTPADSIEPVPGDNLPQPRG